MKRLILTATTLVSILGFSACVPHTQPRKKPVTGPRIIEPSGPSDRETPPSDDPTDKPKHDVVVDPAPVRRNDKIPPPPTPNNPEYAIKVEGKPGYVKSPYDGQGRLIDVRGLPPGTEAECPYTRRTFLVPP